ncbi:GTPase activating protein (SH3 domain) binding protein [Datura stramonium]|uniref:GTPase activating protein (SH3 domain) binding protein n=1 Tax=Datura stramonium TaxID=4076 RepID=A0ABS8WLW3_DATST|nr:GTPase activating protein (SH3 domain) binding protein [Datura stramonium]
MTTQTTGYSTEEVASIFVGRYYQIIQNYIDYAYRFYKENSVLSWPQSDGEIKSVRTSKGINEFIISSHFKGSKVNVTTVDCQSSIAGGVLVMVTACLIGQDDSRKNFSQSFFLAPQETGYYILNDMFRFVGVNESSTVVEEKVNEHASIALLATESKAGDIVKEVSDKSETKVTINDQDGQKSSITSSANGKPVLETTPVIQNEAPKVSYASMIKQGRSSLPTNVPHKIGRVVADVVLPSTPKKPQANVLVQALTSSSSGMSKVVAPSTNAAQDNFYDDIQYKSIYIGGLPSNTTRSDLYAIVKEFGPVQSHNIQLKIYDDGYCCGFVHFEDEFSAQNAVQTRHIIVKGKRAYIRFKKLNKGHGEKREGNPQQNNVKRGSKYN